MLNALTFLVTHHPPEVVGKKGYRRSGLLERFFGATPVCNHVEIGSSVHRSAVAAQFTRKHFVDTPALQFGRVGIANTNQQ